MSIEREYVEEEIDFSRDQHLMSIRKDGREIGSIEAKGGKLVTSGEIGDNEYANFVEMIKGLWGHGIHIDNFFT
jgi:hypothetical protein